MADDSRPLPDLVPELRECAEALEEQSDRVRSMVSPLSERQFFWRPDPDRWSLGQNLTHLALTNRSYVRAVERAVEEARANGHVADPPYRHPWLGRWFIRALEPPPRLKVKTFSRLEPPEDGSREEVLGEFEEAQREVLRSMEASNGVDLGRARFPSPFFGALKLSVGQAYRIILAHNRRHFHQMRGILENESFPRG